MSPEERQLLSALFDRVKSAAATPRDSDADIFVADAVRAQPYAPYYLAQAVIVQEKGLEAADLRIRQLEERVRQLEAGETDHQQAEQSGGFLSSIFGSGRTQQAATHGAGPWGNAPRQAVPQDRSFDGGRPVQQQPQPSGPWNPQPYAPSAGSSFLHGALGTAAGVAGGMLLANSLSGIFGNHMSSLGLGSPLAGGLASAPVEETVINNYYGDDDKSQQAADDARDDSNNDNNIQQADYDPSDDTGNDQSDFGGDDSFDA